MSAKIEYGVLLVFDGDKKAEESWWYGTPHGFHDWFNKIGASTHPRLTGKQLIRRETVTRYGEVELIDGTQ